MKQIIRLLFFFIMLLMPERQLRAQDPFDEHEDLTFEQDDESHELINQNEDEIIENNDQENDYYIGSITVTGNTTVPTNAILNHVPYKVGQLYQPREFIKELYYTLKRFRSIKVICTPQADNIINIEIAVQEKELVDQVLIEGNKNLNSKEILKVINADEMIAIDPEELGMFAQRIKKLYADKGYCKVQIDTRFITEIDNLHTVIFSINEGSKSLVKRINFEGNTFIESKKLRTAIYTREDWFLGFLDKSGSYHPERALYGDTQAVEQLYQNNGFLYAKVVDVRPDINPKSGNIDLTFVIEEGDQFTISSIDIEETEEFNKELLLAALPLRVGMLYSREAISMSIKRLERAWGSIGYIFTHIEPSIIPNPITKTVDIKFSFERGNRFYLNRINVKGNKKTRDRVIRRRIILQEGEIITQDAMDQSKQNVQSLGYFAPRDGVDWKLRRIDEENADLDLIVQEAKTGHFELSLNFGGSGADLRSPTSGLSAKLGLVDTNFAGSGINLNFSVSWAKEEQTVLFHIAHPYVCDRPILAAFDVYHKRPTYDELQHLDRGVVHEKLTGGAITGGFITRSGYQLLHDTNVLGSIGVDSIRYAHHPRSLIITTDAVAAVQQNQEFQSILDKAFTNGDFVWLSTNMEQDMRSHPMHPSHGHRWKLSSRIAIPSFNHKLGFYKISLDTHWYTTLIDEYDLVFHTHTFCGIASPLKNHLIPFGELFHIGGPASVRGFRFGEIGPKFLGDTTIGAKKALFLNAELIFPITTDYSIKGVIFYDGGASWDNPYLHGISKINITDNSFDYRHSVGIGVRLTNPMPIKVDWGFKIDPRKNRLDHRRDETASEVHFTMAYDW